MSNDQKYADGDLVWVKLGNSWWPGEVMDEARQPEGLLGGVKKKPYCVVKFFNEEAFEYVKNDKLIYPFQCTKKKDFIKKGLAANKSNEELFKKFGADVEYAETKTAPIVNNNSAMATKGPVTMILNISKRDDTTKALSPATTASVKRAHSEKFATPISANNTMSAPHSNSVSSSGDSSNVYRCGLCSFTSLRQNVMIFHRKTHSGASPSTPSASNFIKSGTPNASIIESRTETPAGSRRESTVSTASSKDMKVTAKDELTESANHVKTQAAKVVIKVARLKTTTKKDSLKSAEKVKTANDVENDMEAEENDLGNTEEIRKRLLADWSDEEKECDEIDGNNETNRSNNSTANNKKSPHYATPMKQHHPTIVSMSTLEGAGEMLMVSSAPISSTTSPAAIVPTTPDSANTSANSVPTPKSSPRIRNIPKKDRREIVLSEFNKDPIETPPTAIEKHDGDGVTTISSDENVIASSDSSVKQQKVKNQTPKSKSVSGSENTEQNAGPISCFDFQDEEEDVENGILPSIAKFKKKYYAIDKEKPSSKEQDDKHDESLSQQSKQNQQLSEEIDSFLADTTSVVTSSRSSSKDEMPVKGLPIKERGKRIFKSRNRSRVEDDPIQQQVSESNQQTDPATISSPEARDGEDVIMKDLNAVQDGEATSELKQERSNEVSPSLSPRKPYNRRIMQTIADDETTIPIIRHSPVELYKPVSASPDDIGFNEDDAKSSDIITENESESIEKGSPKRRLRGTSSAIVTPPPKARRRGMTASPLANPTRAKRSSSRLTNSSSPNIDGRSSSVGVSEAEAECGSSSASSTTVDAHERLKSATPISTTESANHETESEIQECAEDSYTNSKEIQKNSQGKVKSNLRSRGLRGRQQQPTKTGEDSDVNTATSPPKATSKSSGGLSFFDVFDIESPECEPLSGNEAENNEEERRPRSRKLSSRIQSPKKSKTKDIKTIESVQAENHQTQERNKKTEKVNHSGVNAVSEHKIVSTENGGAESILDCSEAAPQSATETENLKSRLSESKTEHGNSNGNEKILNASRTNGGLHSDIETNKTDSKKRNDSSNSSSLHPRKRKKICENNEYGLDESTDDVTSSVDVSEDAEKNSMQNHVETPNLQKKITRGDLNSSPVASNKLSSSPKLSNQSNEPDSSAMETQSVNAVKNKNSHSIRRSSNNNSTSPTIPTKIRKTLASSASVTVVSETDAAPPTKPIAKGVAKNQLNKQRVNVLEALETVGTNNGVSSSAGSVPTTPQPVAVVSDETPIEDPASEENIDPNGKILAVPTQPIPGYNETFLLCTVINNNYKPIDNVPLYLDHDLNQLVPVPSEACQGNIQLIVNQPPSSEDSTTELDSSKSELPTCSKVNTVTTPEGLNSQSQITVQQIDSIEDDVMEANTENKYDLQESEPQMLLQPQDIDAAAADDVEMEAEALGTESVLVQQDQPAGVVALPTNVTEISADPILLNIEGQHLMLDPATVAHLLSNPDANAQLILEDGTEIVLTHEEALAVIQAQHEQNAELMSTPIDQQQLQGAAAIVAGAGTSPDLIAAALANTELYGTEVLQVETTHGLQLVGADGSVVFQAPPLPQPHLTPPIKTCTSATNTVLDKTPIMSTLENPSTAIISNVDQNLTNNGAGAGVTLLTTGAVSDDDVDSPIGRRNLEDSLAVIGVSTQSSIVPISLELPITVTNPAIAPKVSLAGGHADILQFQPDRSVTTSVANDAAMHIFTDVDS